MLDHPVSRDDEAADHELAEQRSWWLRDDCPHNVRCTSERACNRYEAHKNRVRKSFQ